HTMPTMSAACSKKPSTLARTPKPKMLAKMPANKPPKRIERQPPKRDAPLNGAWAVVGFVGWVKDFSTGATLGWEYSDRAGGIRKCSAKVAERRGWQVVEIYRDAGISGAKGRSQRPRRHAQGRQP